MILVTFAVPFESAAFRRMEISDQVRIVHTGVGADAARVAIEQALCEGEMPQLVVAAGFAGALTPEFQIGDVVCNEPPRTAGRQARFATASEVLATVAEKQAFQQKTGADIVDMETDAIQEVCAVAHIPVVAFRVISDGAGDDLGLPADLLAKLTTNPILATPRLLWTLLVDGSRRKSFLRLIRDCRQAQVSLGSALDREIRARLQSG